MTKLRITDFAVVLYRTRSRSLWMNVLCAALLGGFPTSGADGASTRTIAEVRTAGDMED